MVVISLSEISEIQKASENILFTGVILVINRSLKIAATDTTDKNRTSEI